MRAKQILKVAFLDRDGVINKKAYEDSKFVEYVTKTRDFKFNTGIFDALKVLKEKGFVFIVITNQRAVAKGLMTEKDLESIHGYMKDEFKKRGIEILDIFYCPHDHDVCECRKPKPGMLQAAIKKYNINLDESILISDRIEDVEMGEKFGVGKNFLVSHDKPEEVFQQLIIS